MTKDEALRLAMAALVKTDAEPESKAWERESEAINAIKEALEQTEQEPVAWMDDYNACKCPDNEARCFSDKVFRMMQKHTNSLVKQQEPVAWRYKIVDVFGRPAWTLKTPKSDTRVLESQPLYTTPPQRTWVGLTDEEIQYCVELKNPEAIAEEVEAKLKEKNT